MHHDPKKWKSWELIGMVFYNLTDYEATPYTTARRGSWIRTNDTGFSRPMKSHPAPQLRELSNKICFPALPTELSPSGNKKYITTLNKGQWNSSKNFTFFFNTLSGSSCASGWPQFLRNIPGIRRTGEGICFPFFHPLEGGTWQHHEMTRWMFFYSSDISV